MIHEIGYVTLPTDYSQDRSVLFMEQHNYGTRELTKFYTYTKKDWNAGQYCVAIFTIKPKKTAV
jgi:hypothetical protein